MMMFCDGKCENKGKRCGLYTQVTMQKGTEIKTFDMCIFKALLEAQVRQELGTIRLQAAVESARNEQANAAQDAKQTIGLGFLGLIHSVSGNPRAVEMVKAIGKQIPSTEIPDSTIHAD